ncbi:MAG: hypothetical protein R3F56_18180 [Planctomycetota bacterium]
MVSRALSLILLLTLAAFGRAQAGYAQFVADFQKAQQFKDDKLLDRSLRAHGRSVLAFYYGLAREWRNGTPEGSNKAREQMDILLASWKRVFDTPTLDKVERYYASIDATILKQLDINQQALETTQRNLAEASAAKRRQDLDAARETLWKLADTYEKLGHGLYAAEAWENVAVALTSLPDITLQERKDAVFALERYKEHRESWGFTEEDTYKKNIAWLNSTKGDLAAAEKVAAEREAKGVAGDARGVDAVVDPKAPEIVADLRFEAMKSEIQDCFIQGGAVMPNWQVVELLEETSKQLAYFQGSPLYAAHIGGKYYVSPTADDVVEKGTQITPSNKPKPSSFYLDEQKSKPYAMWFFLGTDKEPFMGLEQNLQSDNKRALLYYKSAASYKAEVNGEEVTLYDSNGDGRLLNPDPYAFGLQVPTVSIGETTAVPGYDSMQIGKKGPIQPFSAYARIGDKWFHLRAAKEGAAVSARPVIPEFLETGTLQLKWTGPRSTAVQCLVVRGEGELKVAAFNLAGGKPVEVPAGVYAIDFGRIGESKGNVWSTADILRGASALITVKKGENTVLTVGAPFRFEFERGGSGADVEVNTHKIKVLGVAGEHYAHLNGCVPEIDVFFAKDEKGRGAKSQGTLGPVPDAEIATKLNTEFPGVGYYCPMFPVVKGAKEKVTLLRFTPPGTGFVGLRAPKAKLFGKIDSAWK